MPCALSAVLCFLPFSGAAKAHDPNIAAAPSKPRISYCAASPRVPWMSASEVETRMREMGFETIRIRLGDDKCYAVAVKAGEGRERDLLVHPVTAEIVRE